MKSDAVVVTIDLDWACEAAVIDVLDWLCEASIPATVFATHHSAIVAERLAELEVGLHPYFASDSSHGDTHADVVRHVLALPHNLRAFRCHRFAVSNEIRGVMAAAGMVVSSNVCTDLEVVAPFRDRFGLLEVPVFLEDGGFLFREHRLDDVPRVISLVAQRGPKVIVIHPMHFAINTPHFAYMTQIKRSVSRSAWNGLTASDLGALRWRGRGIRDFICELLLTIRERESSGFAALGELARHYAVGARHSPATAQSSIQRSSA